MAGRNIGCYPLGTGFKVLNPLLRLTANTDFDNLASQAVVKKLGLSLYRNEDGKPEWFEVLGVLEREMGRIPNGQVYIIPGSPETRGHSTTGGQAKLYAKQVADFLAAVPKMTN